MRIRALLFSIFVLPLLAPAFCSVSGQTAATDSFRLRRDIRIMESILDRLIDLESDIQLTHEVKGLYIPEYGLIFYIKKPQPYQPVMLKTLQENINQVRIQTKPRRRLDTKIGNQIDQNIVNDEDLYIKFKKETEKIEANALTQIKSGISEFFENYASATSLLNKNDHIAVLVHLDGWRSPSHQNGFLTAWIDQKDAEALRLSRGDDASLKSKIHFEMKTRDASLTKDIDILTEILEQAMATGASPRYASTSGFYLNDLGALIFMDIQPAFWFGQLDSSFSLLIRQHGNTVSGYRYSSSESKPQHNQRSEQIVQLGDELFDLLATYGHTLQLKPEERIFIDVNLGTQFSFFDQITGGPVSMRMQIQKRDLDSYSQGKMKLNQLKKKLILSYY